MSQKDLEPSRVRLSLRDFSSAIDDDDPYLSYLPIPKAVRPLVSPKLSSVDVDSVEPLKTLSGRMDASVVANIPSLPYFDLRTDTTTAVKSEFVPIQTQMPSHSTDRSVQPSMERTQSIAAVVTTNDVTTNDCVDNYGYNAKYNSFITESIAYQPQLNVIKPWVCPNSNCNSKFVNRSALVVHYRKHTEFAFICDICQRAFARHPNFVEHKRVHSGERPFQCHLCAFKTKQKHTLKDHLLVHSGEMPHRCQYCSKRFRLKHNMTKHIKCIHQKLKYKCNECGKVLRSKQSLTSHRKCHNSKK